MSKERLEEIKKRYENDREVAKYAGITLTFEDYEWLIEQAECVEELEERHDYQVDETDRYKLTLESIQYIQEWGREEPDYGVLSIVNKALEGASE